MTIELLPTMPTEDVLKFADADNPRHFAFLRERLEHELDERVYWQDQVESCGPPGAQEHRDVEDLEEEIAQLEDQNDCLRRERAELTKRLQQIDSSENIPPRWAVQNAILAYCTEKGVGINGEHLNNLTRNIMTVLHPHLKPIIRVVDGEDQNK